MEIMAASGRVPVQMGLREAYTVFLLIGSLETSVGLLIWSAVIICVLLGWFSERPWILDIIDAKVVPNLVAAASFIG